MPDTEQPYVDTLANQLHTRHPDLLATAENDLAVLRTRIALTVAFIHDPTYDHNARTALAQRLGLPGPAHPKTTPETT
ncbi:hypothetical protein HZZ00_37820 (plasmid) [Streptomyces sp. NEAU-sy36]|uniref:hypothetical protein n=1 Tax=unclassified Streptomyces TaxID=2593676 RepID=UPI0015D59004|nr:MULTISPECIES: hypothetical protein [unclassified Streptomyces]QLJ06790.1 hypothetical protein HZZ00_37820 [Streptomyces sp. NEAU-sy36]